MQIDFEQLDETIIPQFYGGEKETKAQMYADRQNKIMRGSLEPGASIGLHTHQTSSEIVFILSGSGTASYDGVSEALFPGCCHYCPKGHTHSLRNTGSEPLVFLAVVPEQ